MTWGIFMPKHVIEAVTDRFPVFVENCKCTAKKLTCKIYSTVHNFNRIETKIFMKNK